MQPLRYTINITLDGCADHLAGSADPALHHFHAEQLARNDMMLCGRVIYEMMESAWRAPCESGVLADWMAPWMLPFARAIHAIPKIVVSRTLPSVDWNAELLQEDLADAVRALKARPGRGIALGGVTLPRALAALGLIDEYEFVMLPRIAGRGPTVLAGLPAMIDLELVHEYRLSSGALALRYVPAKVTASPTSPGTP